MMLRRTIRGSPRKFTDKFIILIFLLLLTAIIGGAMPARASQYPGVLPDSTGVGDLKPV